MSGFKFSRPSREKRGGRDGYVEQRDRKIKILWIVAGVLLLAFAGFLIWDALILNSFVVFTQSHPLSAVLLLVTLILAGVMIHTFTSFRKDPPRAGHFSYGRRDYNEAESEYRKALSTYATQQKRQKRALIVGGVVIVLLLMGGLVMEFFHGYVAQKAILGSVTVVTEEASPTYKQRAPFEVARAQEAQEQQG